MRPLTDRGKSVLALQINRERSRHSKLAGGKHVMTGREERHEPRRVRIQNFSCRMHAG